MQSFLPRVVMATGLAVGLAAQAAADPALFAARDADTTVHLFGTIHFAKCEASPATAPAGATPPAPAACVDWMSDTVQVALSAANQFWVETVDVTDEALVAALTEDLGYLDGMLLTDLMPEEEVKAIAEMIAGRWPRPSCPN